MLAPILGFAGWGWLAGGLLILGNASGAGSVFFGALLVALGLVTLRGSASAAAARRRNAYRQGVCDVCWGSGLQVGGYACYTCRGSGRP